MEEQGMILEDFYIAVKKRWIMVLVLILVPVLMLAFKPKSEGISVQEYEASTRLYVIRTDLETIAVSPKGSIEYNLLNSFVESLKTEKTIEEALGGTNLEVDEVSSNIYAKIFQDSNIVDLSLKGTDESAISKVLENIVEIAENTVTDYIPNSKVSAIDTINVSEVPQITDQGNTKKIILIFGAMTFIALLLAITLEYLDDSFKHDYQIEKTLKESVLAVFLRKNKDKKLDYNKIATNLSYNHKDINKILISSTTNNEDKNEFVTGIASAIAENGNKVLLIDTECLSSKAIEVEKLTKIKDIDNLIEKKEYDVITVNGNNLSEDTIKDLFTKLEETYRYILINGTPINDGVVSQSFAKEVDGTIYIVKGYKNKRKLILKSINELKAYNSNIIGIVLNNIEV